METEYKVKITPYALGQMHDIVKYIATTLQAPDSAKRWLARMRKELSTLSRFPARYPMTEEEPWHSQGIHKVGVANHLVYYWIDEVNLTVWVIAIIYGRRDQREQLSFIEQDRG